MHTMLGVSLTIRLQPGKDFLVVTKDVNDKAIYKIHTIHKAIYLLKLKNAQGNHM